MTLIACSVLSAWVFLYNEPIPTTNYYILYCPHYADYFLKSQQSVIPCTRYLRLKKKFVVGLQYSSHY